jgi:hypothetical protein
MRHPVLLPVLVLLLLAPATLLAQPGPFGCHFFHGQQAPMGPLEHGFRSDIQATIARSDTFDILHYEIEIDVTDYAGQRIVAATTITYKALQPNVGRILFDLLDLDVDSILSPEGPLDFDHDGQFLEVFFDVPPAVDEEREMTVYYQGVPYRDPQWGGFYFASNYIYNLGIGISTIPPHFGKVWYPCFDSFVERATYTYHVKSAGTFRLYGQGTFLGEVQLDGDTVVRSYTMQQPIPTHLSAIAVADYAVHEYTHEGAYGDIPVTLTAKPANLPGMISRMVDLGDAIDALEFWYGPYGFDRVGYVLTTDGALEIPTNVAYPQFMTTQNQGSNRRLLTHELGHHWWGDVVTPYIHNDMWLKEGPAEYSAHLIEEWQSGQTGLVRAVKDNQLFILRQAHLNDDGFQALSPMPDQHIYGTHTYYKGASVMHNLRGYLGDTLFRQAMMGIQEDYAYTTLSAVGFKDALEATTGEDLDPFFDAWVFQPGYSVFEVRSFGAEEMGGQWQVDLTVGQKLRAATQHHQQVPIDLTFISADGQEHDQLVVVGGESTALSVNAPFEPAMAVLNRHTRLNQARMDHELWAVPGQNLSPVLPYVDFRLFVDQLEDSSFVRIDHIWAAPDQEPLAAEILEMSGTHYWNVDGRWPESTVFRGRLLYFGANNTQLDHELIAGNEAGISIVYRASPMDPWEVYPEQEVTAGSLTNGTGYITMYNLRKGQYAFAKSSAIVAVEETTLDVVPDIAVFPVPATDRITIAGQVDAPEQLVFDVMAMDGRIVLRSTEMAHGHFLHAMDLGKVAVGPYVMRVMTTTGQLIGSKRFEVLR